LETLLSPLSSLTAADDVTGMARGVAFQLVESLGVLERQKVAEEVKALDQPARAILRKYAVRFAAYHIYWPALLKPAPRALATQLWAVKHESPEAKGVGDLLHLAASGRTSIPVDNETPQSPLPTRRLSRLRRTRVSRRYSGTACRSHPAGAVLARRGAPARTRRAFPRHQLSECR